MAVKKEWTIDDIEYLKNHTHVSAKDLVEKFGVTTATISKFRKKIGYPCTKNVNKKVSSEILKFIIDERETGLSQREIKEKVWHKFGVKISQWTIGNWIGLVKGTVIEEEIKTADVGKIVTPEDIEDLIKYNKFLEYLRVDIEPGDTVIDRSGRRMRVLRKYKYIVLLTNNETIMFKDIAKLIR